MEEESKGIQDYIQVLKRQKKQIIFTSVIIFFIAVLVAMKLPAMYKSTAIILIEQQEIPQELVRSTVTSYADQRIQVISQRVMSTENLKAVIEKFNLYTEDRKNLSSAVVLDAMRADIQLDMVSADVIDPRSGRPMQATIAFNLSYASKSAKKAQQVANELVSLYLNENLKRRTQAASETTSFLAIEANKLSDQITKIEEKLAEFKEKNAASLPELQNLNMQLMDRTEQQIIEVDRQVNSLNERKLYLNAELAQLSPNLSTYSTTGERIYGSEDRLKALQAEYVALTAKYASTHPDVIKMQREIIALEKDVGGIDKTEIQIQLKNKNAELITLSQRYSANHPDVKKLKQQIVHLEAELTKPAIKKQVFSSRPDNPAYIQLQAQMNAIIADLSAMKKSKLRLVAKLDTYETGLMKAPQVDREYKNLMRDYDNATLKYREVKAKQMEADMAQAMEKDRKGERFTLIEPPLFPEKPFKPNRIAIVFMGFILAIGISFGFALLKAGLDRSIYGIKRLTALSGAPPLIVIPYIENDEDVQSTQGLKKKTIVIILVSIFAGITLFHLLIMPLDVLWYAGLRKLGLSAL
ncbi:MAG: Wzz/FepE/Etk N-terminal domain-containing protein [Methylococcaceae bacterium]|nr:Wzz/FepE/Etk N-terminal domain-containing protein [Methylococcaceae bacterium]